MENNKFKWRKQDYFWLIGFLMGIILFVCTIRLSDNADAVNIISLIASGVSIALAFIAIWWGQVNNSETNKIYDKINEKLDSVKGETIALNQTIKQIKSELSEKLFKQVDSLPVSNEEKERLKSMVNNSIDSVEQRVKFRERINFSELVVNFVPVERNIRRNFNKKLLVLLEHYGDDVMGVKVNEDGFKIILYSEMNNEKFERLNSDIMSLIKEFNFKNFKIHHAV